MPLQNHPLPVVLPSDSTAGLRKYASPPVSLLAQTLCKVREDEELVLLVAPYRPIRTWLPELMLLATAPPWPIPLEEDLLSQRWGTLWLPRALQTTCVVPGRGAEALGDLPQGVVDTITVDETGVHLEVEPIRRMMFFLLGSPRSCSIRAVLSFWQQALERRLSPSA